MFKDREDAGCRLLSRLQSYKDKNPLVFALPRGGVSVGYQIAVGLNAPLDVLIVRKLGAPGQPELAIGALIDGDHPQTIFNEKILSALNVSDQYIEREIQSQIREIKRREDKYRGNRPRLQIKDQTVIVVDDGIATGATIKAALRGLRQQQPGQLVLAVPVAPPNAIALLRKEVDDAVCLSTPWNFSAVGQFYEDFHAVADEEVIELLNLAWARKAE